MSVSEPKTWADLAEKAKLVEEPFEVLEVDPARWDPVGTQSRMEKVTNALLDLYRQQGENKKTLTELGVRSGDEYKAVHGAQLVIDSKIKALEKKHETLTGRAILKNQEYKRTG
jgi:hypothetical protein